jgi:hypothetical protein
MHEHGVFARFRYNDKSASVLPMRWCLGNVVPGDDEYRKLPGANLPEVPESDL